jgi:hypothetical protein
MSERGCSSRAATATVAAASVSRTAVGEKAVAAGLLLLQQQQLRQVWMRVATGW